MMQHVKYQAVTRIQLLTLLAADLFRYPTTALLALQYFFTPAFLELTRIWHVKEATVACPAPLALPKTAICFALMTRLFVALKS